MPCDLVQQEKELVTRATQTNWANTAVVSTQPEFTTPHMQYSQPVVSPAPMSPAPHDGIPPYSQEAIAGQPSYPPQAVLGQPPYSQQPIAVQPSYPPQAVQGQPPYPTHQDLKQ
jgi:hypothetical protein